MRRATSVWLGLLLATTLIGCSSSTPPTMGPTNPTEVSLQKLGLAYRDASTALRRGPANLEELQPYLSKYGEAASILVSANDGQPFQIVWGIEPHKYGKKSVAQRLLAYEEIGKSGKRYVLDFMLQQHHLSESEFAQMKGSP